MLLLLLLLLLLLCLLHCRTGAPACVPSPAVQGSSAATQLSGVSVIQPATGPLLSTWARHAVSAGAWLFVRAAVAAFEGTMHAAYAGRLQWFTCRPTLVAGFDTLLCLVCCRPDQ
jgi:hypothetical protein